MLHPLKVHLLEEFRRGDPGQPEQFKKIPPLIYENLPVDTPKLIGWLLPLKSQLQISDSFTPFSPDYPMSKKPHYTPYPEVPPTGQKLTHSLHHP